MDRIILVTGATGKQGGAVARHLLRKGWSVRALTRSPEKEEAVTLLKNGAQIIKGDLEDTTSLQKALKSVYGVYSVQNSWEHGVAKEVQQGKVLAEEAKRAGVAHFVYSSVGSAHRATGIPHFESKWQIEQFIRSSGLRATIFRPVFFMDNLLMPDTLSAVGDGTLPMGTDPDTPLQMIAVDDIGAFVQLAFDNPDEFIGKEIDIAGDELTGPQTAGVLEQVLNKPIAYRQTPIEQIRSFSSDYAVMTEWFNTKGYEADIPALRKMHPALMTFEKWTETKRDIFEEIHAHA